MARPSLTRAARGLLLVVASVLGACTGDEGAAPSTTTSKAPPTPPPAPTGIVRVAVWDEPDPAAPTLGGAGVRALVLPQLFVAQPDGRWASSLVAPRSDRDGPERRSASFRLRPGARWSDGSPITVEDLRRTADARFVAGVDGPAPNGTITVRFTQALPGWRRLWSGVDSIAAPRHGVWGGPFVVAGRTPGLETVLRRNEHWYGGSGPFLEEVRLVLVPDATTARELLDRDEVDVVMPPAATVRTEQLQRLDGVEVASTARTGWATVLLLEPSRLPKERRLGVVASVDRRRFVSTLLREEASVADGFAGPEDATWSTVRPGTVGDVGTVDLVGAYEESMAFLLQRSMQKRAHPGGGRLELRNAEFERVQGWVAERSFDAAVVPVYDGPDPCWLCRWGSVDEGLARRADAGEPAALQARLRDEAVVLPLWRPRVVVAWRSQVEGVRANGYALTAAWNAFAWRLGATSR